MNTHRRVDCNTVQDMLLKDGGIDDAIGRHVAECERCAEFSRTLDVLNAVSPVDHEPPRELDAAILAHASARSRDRRRIGGRLWTTTAMRPLLAVAAALVLVMGMVWVSLRPEAPVGMPHAEVELQIDIEFEEDLNELAMILAVVESEIVQAPGSSTALQESEGWDGMRSGVETLDVEMYLEQIELWSEGLESNDGGAG